MEAIMIGGLAVLAVGGYYTLIDAMNDLGLCKRTVRVTTKKLSVTRNCIITPQTGIKKMAGMNI
jgi:hypothetical protein